MENPKSSVGSNSTPSDYSRSLGSSDSTRSGGSFVSPNSTPSSSDSIRSGGDSTSSDSTRLSRIGTPSSITLGTSSDSTRSGSTGEYSIPAFWSASQTLDCDLSDHEVDQCDLSDHEVEALVDKFETVLMSLESSDREFFLQEFMVESEIEAVPPASEEALAAEVAPAANLIATVDKTLESMIGSDESSFQSVGKDLIAEGKTFGQDAIQQKMMSESMWPEAKNFTKDNDNGGVPTSDNK